MTQDKNNPLSLGDEESFSLTLYEVTCSFGVEREIIIEIVNEGIVPAQKNDRNELQFDAEALRRIRMVLRLQQDLGINLSGAGLALELLDEIDRLRALLR